jgi:hypothetical protein
LVIFYIESISYLLEYVEKQLQWFLELLVPSAIVIKSKVEESEKVKIEDQFELNITLLESKV